MNILPKARKSFLLDFCSDGQPYDMTYRGFRFPIWWICIGTSLANLLKPVEI